VPRGPKGEKRPADVIGAAITNEMFAKEPMLCAKQHRNGAGTERQPRTVFN
jgi:hypothetical protein